MTSREGKVWEGTWEHCQREVDTGGESGVGILDI